MHNCQSCGMCEESSRDVQSQSKAHERHDTNRWKSHRHAGWLNDRTLTGDYKVNLDWIH